MSLDGFPILSMLVALPLMGFAFVLLTYGEERQVARSVRALAYWASGNVLLLALILAFAFDRTTPDFQFVERYDWLQPLGISYRVGVDGISLGFIVLTAFLTVACLVASARATHRVKEYVAAFLALEALVMGAFTALDLVAFYIFFEGVLLPMFFLIGVWGGPKRVSAAFKFFLFTLTGSVLMLAAVFVLYHEGGTTDIERLAAQPLDPVLQIPLWLAFFASFAVKTPMWPFHTWLPSAHVEAPTEGSMILAGLLLKLGAYGFLRFSLPMFPYASEMFAPLVFVLSGVAVVYASLLAFAQEDMKRTIAYASIAHMGYVTLGIFSATQEGVEGALMQSFSHGLVSAALFMCVGVLYERRGSRALSDFGGAAQTMPRFAVFFMVAVLAAIGLPGTSGFVGEFLVLSGAWQVWWLWAAVVASGVVLSAVYMLNLYRRVMFGRRLETGTGAPAALSEAAPFEQAALAPMTALILLLGLAPSLVLDTVSPSARAVVARMAEDAASRQGASLSPLGAAAP